MKESKLQPKEILYGFAMAIAILASAALLMGENQATAGQMIKGDILHSNYLMPHVSGDH